MKVKHFPFILKLNLIVLVFMMFMTVLFGEASYDRKAYTQYMIESERN